MATLYRILIRLAVAWLAVAGIVVLIACAAFNVRALDVTGLLGLVVLAPAFLVGTLACTIKPATCVR
jgi:hypothetical protein